MRFCSRQLSLGAATALHVNKSAVGNNERCWGWLRETVERSCEEEQSRPSWSVSEPTREALFYQQYIRGTLDSLMWFIGRARSTRDSTWLSACSWVGRHCSMPCSIATRKLFQCFCNMAQIQPSVTRSVCSYALFIIHRSAEWLDPAVCLNIKG